MSQHLPQRRVHFRERRGALRELYDDEYSVMAHFSKHVDICRTCFIPTRMERTPVLCREGYDLSKDVCRYFRLNNGMVVSSLPSRSPLEIAIPRKFAVTTYILREQQQGSKTGRKQTPLEAEYRQSHGKSPRISSKNSTDVITVYVTLPALTIPLHLRRADLRDLSST